LSDQYMILNKLDRYLYTEVWPEMAQYRWYSSVFSPHDDFDARGIEDPRITEIGGVFYMTYTAYWQPTPAWLSPHPPGRQCYPHVR